MMWSYGFILDTEEPNIITLSVATWSGAMVSFLVLETLDAKCYLVLLVLFELLVFSVAMHMK